MSSFQKKKLQGILKTKKKAQFEETEQASELESDRAGITKVVIYAKGFNGKSR